MRKLAVVSSIAFLMIMLVPLASGADVLGISPGCIRANGQECSHYPVVTGQTESFRLHIFNLMDGENYFQMRAERDLANNVVFTPSTFTLSSKHDRSTPSTGCIPEEGCQVVYVSFNAKGVAPGKYETLLIASTSFSQEGSLALNAEVGSRLLVEVQENSFYKITRILKENFVVVLAAIILAAALFFVIFRRKIQDFFEKTKANKIYKDSKEKHKK